MFCVSHCCLITWLCLGYHRLLIEWHNINRKQVRNRKSIPLIQYKKKQWRNSWSVQSARDVTARARVARATSPDDENPFSRMRSASFTSRAGFLVFMQSTGSSARASTALQQRPFNRHPTAVVAPRCPPKVRGQHQLSGKKNILLACWELLPVSVFSIPESKLTFEVYIN